MAALSKLCCANRWCGGVSSSWRWFRKRLKTWQARHERAACIAASSPPACRLPSPHTCQTAAANACRLCQLPAPELQGLGTQHGAGKRPRKPLAMQHMYTGCPRLCCTCSFELGGEARAPQAHGGCTGGLRPKLGQHTSSERAILYKLIKLAVRTHAGSLCSAAACSSAASAAYPQPQLLSRAHTNAPPIPRPRSTRNACSSAGSCAPRRWSGSAVGIRVQSPCDGLGWAGAIAATA